MIVKKLFQCLILLISLSAMGMLHSMESTTQLFKETCKTLGRHCVDKESLKIIGAGAVAFCAYRTIQDLILSRIKKYGVRPTPTRQIRECLPGTDQENKHNSKMSNLTQPLINLLLRGVFIGFFTATVARSNLKNQLTAYDLMQPAKVIAITAACLSTAAGITNYYMTKGSVNNIVPGIRVFDLYAHNCLLLLFLPASIALLQAKKQIS